MTTARSGKHQKKKKAHTRMKVKQASKLPKLPVLLEKKLYKTGSTRGADDDQIYQNRVLRNGTALIYLPQWASWRKRAEDGEFENGYIVLLAPHEYFKSENEIRKLGLTLGVNALVFFETREQWNNNNPTALGWREASSRTAPLGGQFVARVPANAGQGAVRKGFAESKSKGAGIRQYEYASKVTIEDCRLQLEAIFWLCVDSVEVVQRYGMSPEDAAKRRDAILDQATEKKLLDLKRLEAARITVNGNASCPLCLECFSAEGFFSKMEQADGRTVHDLTVTQLNLFHVEELRVSTLNHIPYNLGWGHHHCNVVVKDSGIVKTLEWMSAVLERNKDAGHFPKSPS